jgi:hypothetical protein
MVDRVNTLLNQSEMALYRAAMLAEHARIREHRQARRRMARHFLDHLASEVFINYPGVAAIGIGMIWSDNGPHERWEWHYAPIEHVVVITRDGHAPPVHTCLDASADLYVAIEQSIPAAELVGLADLAADGWVVLRPRTDGTRGIAIEANEEFGAVDDLQGALFDRELSVGPHDLDDW